MPETERELINTMRRLETSVDKLAETLVRKDVYDAQRQTDQSTVSAVKQDVEEIKNTLQWLSRAVVTAIVFPLLSSGVIVYFVRGG